MQPILFLFIYLLNFFCNYYGFLVLYKYRGADVAKLVDALDLGSSEQPS